MGGLRFLVSRRRNVAIASSVLNSYKLLSGVRFRNMLGLIRSSRRLFTYLRFGILECLYYIPLVRTVIALNSDRGLCINANSVVGKYVHVLFKKSNLNGFLCNVGLVGRTLYSRVLLFNLIGTFVGYSSRDVTYFSALLGGGLVFYGMRVYTTGFQFVYNQYHNPMVSFLHSGYVQSFRSLVDFSSYYITLVLYSLLVDCLVTEYSCRKMALDAATKNCNELLDNLAFAINGFRQLTITTALTEAVASISSVSSHSFVVE